MITYCSNIHPSESWGEISHALRTNLPLIREAISPGAPFPIGLRLSNLAAVEIGETEGERFQGWCEENGFFVVTMNGFPYGPFHSSRVKEDVYLPDWRYPERVAYTMRLADVLDSWLPPHLLGSISTVPVGFKPHIRYEDHAPVRKNILSVLEHLDRLRQRSGKRIILALEPEPGCVLETTREMIDYLDRLDIQEDLKGLLGICLDCCHQAVEFEEPAKVLALLAESAITIAKVQVSSALALKGSNPGILEGFCEPRYLHQVVVRDCQGVLHRYNDLDDALAKHKVINGDEWRVHFHLPIFLERLPWCSTTRSFIEEALPLLDPGILLEVETYTWEVLPPELRTGSVAESIIREIQWLQAFKQ